MGGEVAEWVKEVASLVEERECVTGDRDEEEEAGAASY